MQWKKDESDKNCRFSHRLSAKSSNTIFLSCSIDQNQKYFPTMGHHFHRNLSIKESSWLAYILCNKMLELTVGIFYKNGPKSINSWKLFRLFEQLNPKQVKQVKQEVSWTVKLPLTKHVSILSLALLDLCSST